MTPPASAAEPTIQLRRLAPVDAAAYLAFRLEALERAPDAFGESATEHRTRTVAAEAARFAAADDDGLVLGGFADARLRAMAGFARETREKARHKAAIWGVYVGEELRGRGVGRLLMTTLLAHARTRPGLEAVWLSVTTGQTAARSLYASLGFVAFGLERAALKLGDRRIDEEYLELVLARPPAPPPTDAVGKKQRRPPT